jgi:ribonucleoside-triphosphate reductase
MSQTLSNETILSFLNDTIPADDLPAPKWGPIGEDVYKRSYSRNIREADGSTAAGWIWSLPPERDQEVWAETVRRVVLGNLAYAHATDRTEAIDLFRLIYDFKMVPAGRHLWMTGVPGAALKNCHRAGWSKDIADHFRFLAMQLFQGGGVGSNYSARFRTRSEKVTNPVSVRIAIHPDHKDYEQVKESAGAHLSKYDRMTEGRNVMWIKVEDTREGWVDAWCTLIRSATLGVTHITFDLTDIRPNGTPLLTMGGRASGPGPLARSLVNISKLLTGTVGKHISATQAMLIDHEIASAIVAGGTRRSARMSQLDWDDPEIFDFIDHKLDTSVSWSTNISVVTDERFFEALKASDPQANAVLSAVAQGMVRNGEPGIYNLALAKVGEKRDVSATNPCGEAILEEHYDPETGLGSASGESCNLGSVDLDAIGINDDEAVRAFELMARFLYRATLAPIYDKDQAEIEDRNRRLGVGLMGLQGWCAAHDMKLSQLPKSAPLKTKLEMFRTVCREAADKLAADLGLPAPIKVTAVAPTGTIAQLRGTTSGIHPVYARYFVRRIQYADTNPRLEEMRAKGYHIEPSVQGRHTSVVSIPVADIILDRHREDLIEQADEISVDKFLAVQAAVQETFCGGTDGQAISATANIPETGLSSFALSEILERHLPHLKGATVFPAMTRPQQPITAISKREWADLSPAIMEKIRVGDSNSGECVGGACPIR